MSSTIKEVGKIRGLASRRSNSGDMAEGKEQLFLDLMSGNLS